MTSVDDLKRVMANKKDEELYDVLHGHPDDFTADAIEAAKEEFTSRDLTAPMLSNLSTAVEAQKRVEDAPLEWPLRILAFFISIVALGIPVLLAHRHYVEKGARRKAREWALWGLFGFFFYFVASVLGFMPRVFSH
jgi:predicted cobalt transporter CbtA